MMEEELQESLTSWLLVLAFVMICVIILHYCLSTRRYYILARKIPATPGLPIIGHAFNFLKGTEEAFRNVWDTKNNWEVCKLWLGSRLFVFIKNPADIELVLGSRNHVCKSIESSFFEPWLGDGINIVSGCKWKSYRELLTSYFQMGRFIEPILRYNNSILENRLLKTVDKDLDCYSYMSDAVMELLLLSIFGENNNKEESKEYCQAIKKLSKTIRHRMNTFWLHPDLIFNLTEHAKFQKDLLKIVHRFTRQAMKNRKEALLKHRYGLDKNSFFFNENTIQNNNNITDCLKEDKRGLSLLDVMMDISCNGVTLMDSEIQNQVDAIMLEGHDATALSGSYFIRVMADRPDIQEKCVAELNEIFGDSERPVTFHDTIEMKYLERSLMETLRMNPPVPFITRESKQELRLASTGLRIPANSTVVVDVNKLHNNEELYPSPDIFDPDNFLREKCVSRHYYSFIPFSAGPRSCIGTKYSMFCLKVLLSSILRKYKILPSSDRENGTKGTRNLDGADGFVVRLEYRKQ